MKIYKNIRKCRLCFFKDLISILDLGNHPPSNTLRNRLKIFIPSVPLKILFCKNCNTVQLSSTVNQSFLFSKYVWVTSTSKTAKNYSKIFCNRVLEKLENRNNNFIIEIASNDGTFLKPFTKYNNQVLGIDPAKNIAKIAIKSGIETLPSFFNLNIAKEIKKNYGKPKVIIARNVIPHAEHIHSILKGVEHILLKKSIVVIEFHYAKIIQEELHYDSIYHEHLFYFTLKSISTLFKKYNLFPFDIDESPISGGSLVLYFSNKKRNYSKKLNKYFETEKKEKINSFNKWRIFSKKCIEHSNNLNKIINYYKKNKKIKIFGYGASARSSTLLNFTNINRKHIDFIIDNNQIKKNKYTPGSNIKILSLKDNMNKIKKYNILLLLAWNFKKEILTDLRKKGFKGKAIIPLPRKITKAKI